MELMTIQPELDKEGRCREEVWGGLRRIDRILLHRAPSTDGDPRNEKRHELNGHKADNDDQGIWSNQKHLCNNITSHKSGNDNEKKQEQNKFETGFEKLYGHSYNTLDVTSKQSAFVSSVWFSTILSGLSDHIPFAVQVKLPTTN